MNVQPLDGLIDNILLRVKDGKLFDFEPTANQFTNDPDLIEIAYKYMINERLVFYDTEAFGTRVHRIHHNGLKIVDAGGWLKYLENVRKETAQKQRIDDLTVKELKGSIFHHKYWWLLSLLSILAGAGITILVQLILNNLAIT